MATLLGAWVQPARAVDIVDGTQILIVNDAANAPNTVTIASSGTGRVSITDPVGVTATSTFCTKTSAVSADCSTSFLPSPVIKLELRVGDDSLFVAEDSGVAVEAFGGGGRDRLIASSGADLLAGGKGNDFLKGSGGRDSIRGGSGKDRCDGGGNFDVAANCESERRIENSDRD